MKRSKKTYVVMSASIFIVAMLLSSAIAVPIKNNEAVENNLKNINLEERNIDRFRRRIQEKLDNDEILKEVIKEKYPEIYEAVKGRFLKYPIFCLATLPVLLAFFLFFWESLPMMQLGLYVWCVICIEGYEQGV